MIYHNSYSTEYSVESRDTCMYNIVHAVLHISRCCRNELSAVTGQASLRLA